jgi:predicted CopG family antitoxin
MAKSTFMRADKQLLAEIKSCKKTPRESYAEVVKRLIEKERRMKK